MKGTEKQIAWAEKIKKVIINTSNEISNELLNDPKFDPNNEQHVKMINIYKSWAELAEKEEQASFFIDTFRLVDEKDPLLKRVKTIRAGIMLSPHSSKRDWKLN